jgi:hypothetical protein
MAMYKGVYTVAKEDWFVVEDRIVGAIHIYPEDREWSITWSPEEGHDINIPFTEENVRKGMLLLEVTRFEKSDFLNIGVNLNEVDYLIKRLVDHAEKARQELVSE